MRAHILVRIFHDSNNNLFFFLSPLSREREQLCSTTQRDASTSRRACSSSIPIFQMIKKNYQNFNN